ncbi:metallophosphoesterase [Pseudalkalibacillus hwajinpoensis]|uniref:Metallophosphoesterase n=1 Tax=Guptibacillus hwajinpoensis TaxID=208199 RepID=A0A4U1MHT3_9BACL|nr:metallophosphoesterase [Pseudalkalibacillus hwajinpoensis]TKD69880.1 metallophosphoesterase [Pseudalkalibacillus hwajinpoensis]
MIYLIGLIVAGLLLLSYMWIEAHLNRVVTQELQIKDLPASFESYRIFFISDLHNRLISNRILSKVYNNIDAVVIGGDVMEKGVSFEKVNENLEQLSKLAPCYFVWGNNDYEENPETLKKILIDHHIKILKNDAAKIVKNNESINFLGIDDLSTENASLEQALGAAHEHTKILISHNPDIQYDLPENNKIQLILSGHTHGGQIRLFGWGIREKGGIKEVNGTTVVISNGFGTTTLPLRLMAPAESHIFILKRK